MVFHRDRGEGVLSAGADRFGVVVTICVSLGFVDEDNWGCDPSTAEDREVAN